MKQNIIGSKMINQGITKFFTLYSKNINTLITFFNIGKGEFRTILDQIKSSYIFICRIIKQFILSKGIKSFMIGLSRFACSIIQRLCKNTISYNITHSNKVYDMIMKKKDLKEFEIFFEKRVKILSNIIHSNFFNDKLIEEAKLKELILSNKTSEYIEDLIKQKRYFTAYRFMNALQYESVSYQELIHAMSNNEMKLQSKIIKEQHLDFQNNQKVLNHINGESLRFFIFRADIPIEKVEELFLGDEKKLQFLVENYFSTNKQVAIQIAKRNNIKVQNIQRQKEIDECINVEQNILLQNDDFLPSEMILKTKRIDQLILLKDLNISREDVYEIENEDQLNDQIVNEILEAKQTGIDSESYLEIPQTKFSSRNKVCLFQIALPKKIFLLNSTNLKKSKKYQEFLVKYTTSDALKIGQNIQQDLQSLLGQIGNYNVELKNVIELQQLFRMKFPNEKKTNLSFQCSKLFGKELDKVEQISNWQQRPLRNAQIHYAALDAFICLHLYNHYKQ
ncbi:unnamed protein product [Paramecium sonneborni]|uniref:3'-5' exonuclease domain-containing protein n=1 Tax=Paramecium sonneborni TaxID=65129 RepID=A0A8S1R1K7_9CILI|nr:unnamed protein product [Paramecium sonneborni]